MGFVIIKVSEPLKSSENPENLLGFVFIVIELVFKVFHFLELFLLVRDKPYFALLYAYFQEFAAFLALEEIALVIIIEAKVMLCLA